MKKNYARSWSSLKGLRSCWQENAGQKPLLCFGIIISSIMFSNQLLAQCPTIEGYLTISNSIICTNTNPGDITLSGYSGEVLKWQSASDADFTSDVVDILFTSDVLTQNETSAISSTTYYRAVVQMEGCEVKYTEPLEVDIAPSVTYADGEWTASPNNLTPVIIASDYTLPANLTVCSCQVTNGATLTVPSTISLIVQNTVTVDAGSNIVVENTGSLIQINDDAVNTGSVTFKTNTTTMKQYDYTYWSSPVDDMTLYSLSPNTLSDKYFSFDPLTDSWHLHPSGTDVMEAAKGYIIRAPQGWNQSNATLGVYEGVFNGTPRNGLVAASVEKGASTYNLIGNPYPSAINLDLFLTDPVNENVLNGTVYLWTHNTAISNLIPGNSVYNYTSDDYAKYNITGGVATASPSISGSARPTSTLTSGQGFFIEINPELADGTYAAQFANYMRIDNNHDQISRPAGSFTPPPSVEKNRIWLNISNSGGAYDEMLVGYISGATNGLDRNYDGTTLPAGNVVGLYSILGENDLSIQGRALPFDENDIIPIGYNTTLAGTFSIGLGNFDGFFENQNVYLHDKMLDVLQDLNDSSYTFISAAGTFDDRFELRFTNSALGVSENDTTSMLVIKMDKEVWIQTPGILKSVTIFDLTGRLVYNQDNINSGQYHTTGIGVSEQMLLVKATLENGLELTRKLILE